MYGVTYLYLLYSQVKECQFIPHGDETFGSGNRPMLVPRPPSRLMKMLGMYVWRNLPLSVVQVRSRNVSSFLTEMRTFGSGTAHAGPQTAVQVDEDARDVCME